MTPNLQSDDDPYRMGDDLDRAAHGSATVLSALPSAPREALPGIASPLRVTVDFAANSQHDAVSITMGNGRVRLAGGLRPRSSGRLCLRLAWSPGFRAHGVAVGDDLGGWTVERADGAGMLLRSGPLGPGHRETSLPVVSVVKTRGAEADDELTARIWGEAEECRGATVRGWSRM